MHYCDVKIGAVASQITSITIVYSTVYSDTDQRKHQSSASLAFVRGIPRTKGQLRRKCFHLMTSSWGWCTSIKYLYIILKHIIWLKCFTYSWNFTQTCSLGCIDNKLALVWVRAWRPPLDNILLLRQLMTNICQAIASLRNNETTFPVIGNWSLKHHVFTI